MDIANIEFLRSEEENEANAALIVQAVNEHAAHIALEVAAKAWKSHGFAIPISNHPEAVAQRALHKMFDDALATLAAVRKGNQ